jgi:phenylalanyl-tRNA synthetase beta chain
VYAPPTDAKDWGQQEKLLLAVTGETSHTWRSRPRPFDFYDITGALEQIWGHFRLPLLILKHQGHHWFDSTVAYAIEFNGEQIGVVGQLTKEIARKFDVKQTVYLAELSLAPLTAQGRLNARFTSLPIYPAAPRDLAIVVEESVRTGDMVAAVKEAVGDLAESVSIFDLYQGKQIDKGKKSIAISISYRSQDGNLSSEEVDAKQQVAVDILKKRFNAEIRDK